MDDFEVRQALREIAEQAVRQTSAVARALIAKGLLEPSDITSEFRAVTASISTSVQDLSIDMESRFVDLIKRKD